MQYLLFTEEMKFWLFKNCGGSEDPRIMPDLFLKLN